MLLILVSCITLAMYRPLLPEDGRWNESLQLADIVLNSLFSAEMVLRMLSVGGVLAYLRHPWNAFDGAMVAAGARGEA